MSNLRLIMVNDADDATLSASPAAVTTLPAANLQNPSRAYIWRSTSTAAQTLLGDFDSLVSVSGVALVRHNLSASATWRFRLYASTGQTGSLLYDSGTVSLLTINASLWFTLVQGCRSFSLVLTDAAAVDYMQASRIFIGRSFEPLHNMAYGLSLSSQTDSVQRRTEAGSQRTEYHGSYKRWSFRLEILNETERPQLFDALRVDGLREDMFLSCFPGSGGALEGQYSGQVKLTRMPEINHDRPQNYSTDVLVFEEA